jgi:hypothetical protein
MKLDLEKLKKDKQKRERAMKTDRFQNVLCFLNQKGLLKTHERPRVIRNRKIDILDIFWAKQFEPRILEVFPAAFIHFESEFKNIEKIPKKLQEIIFKIKEEKQKGPEFYGIKYKDMKRWCNVELKDRRTRPLKSHRKLVTFKFPDDVIHKLVELTKSSNSSKTQVLEQLILKA